MLRMYRNTLIVLCVALLAVLGICFYAYKNNQNLSVACTMEALMCPDGSAVGRSGKLCEFSPCPHIESVTGMLVQDENGFRLIMESPENGGMGVTYALPLQIRVSNALKDFVGKKVVVRGEFSQGNTFVVSLLDYASEDVTEGSVGVGQTKFIGGVRVTLNKIVQDSRCPVDVQCIQAGRVDADITLVSDTDKETVTLYSDGKPHGFDSFLVSIVGVLPEAHTATKQDFSGYVLQIKVVPTKLQ